MIKGIINAFDHIEFYLVINLTMCGSLAGNLAGHQWLLLGMLVLQLP